jgi:pilus assembly protein CpaC
MNTNNPNLMLARLSTAAAAAMAAVLLTAGIASGQTSRPVTTTASTTQPAEVGQMKLMLNKSTVIVTKTPFSRVSVGDPDVADVTPIGPTNLLVTARKPGSTQIIVWDDKDQTQTIDIQVEFDVEALRDQLEKTFPDLPLSVDSANGAVILRGIVPTLQTAEQVALIASPFAPKIINTLEVAGGQQVSLQVKFAEVSRTATNQLGVNFGINDGTSVFGSNAGGVSPLGVDLNGAGPRQLLAPSGQSIALFGAGQAGGTLFSYYIQALRQNSLLRVLAEPNLIAISGQQASFLAGGEFPIPVPQQGDSGSAITITYKEYGVRLKFLPVVLGDGTIRLQVEPEVSDLDFANSVSVGGYPVPGLRTRRVSTTVKLADGQSFALAGLLNDTTFTRKEVTPLLGDIPILGSLFRSSRFERRETELVVLVTPRIVAPMNPGQVPALPGEKWRTPSEMELYFKGDLGGERKPDRAAEPSGPPPLFMGEYGFTQASLSEPVTEPVPAEGQTTGVPDSPVKPGQDQMQQ